MLHKYVILQTQSLKYHWSLHILSVEYSWNRSVINNQYQNGVRSGYKIIDSAR